MCVEFVLFIFSISIDGNATHLWYFLIKLYAELCCELIWLMGIDIMMDQNVLKLFDL